MRRFAINALAAIGALTLLGVLAGFITRAVRQDVFGTVLDANQRPFANAPVFLDRGHRTLEYFVTDSRGRVRLPLSDRALPSAVWLICVPGAVPIIDHQDPHDRTAVTYQFSRLSLPTYSEYRAWGWRGPIPRECPASEREPYLWVYPGVGTVYEQEPEWPTTRQSRTVRQLPNER
jgi:hypothetical protein